MNVGRVIVMVEVSIEILGIWSLGVLLFGAFLGALIRNCKR